MISYYKIYIFNKKIGIYESNQYFNNEQMF